MAGGPEPPVRVFIGRSDAVDQLRRREDEARGGRGGLSLVVGEVGVGKSTLVHVFARECAARGMTVLLGRAGGLDNPPPLQLIRDALAGGPIGGNLGERGAGVPSPLAAMVPSSAEDPVMLGFVTPAERWSAGTPPSGEERILEAIGRTEERPDTRNSGPFRALSDQIRRLVERGPTLIVLEDIHRADDASLEFLEFMMPDLARHPIWILGTALPLYQIREARRARLERLLREARVEEIVIRPLNPQELPEFVRSLTTGLEPDASQLARWHAQSGGNPLFLERLIRNAEAITPAAMPSAPAPAEEPSQRDARPVSGLPPEESRVLSVGAVLGHSFPFSLLLAASGEEEERLTEEVEGLVTRGILREGVDEGLEFVHEETRSQVYSTLTVSRRRLLHSKAGEALERTGAADPPSVYALALHCYLGRLDDKAALYNRMAADLAVHQGSPTVARLHLERALEAHRRAHPGDPLGELEILLDLAVQLDRLGDLREADRRLTEAFQKPALHEAASPGQRALARLYRARILTDQGRWGDADRLTMELLGSADVRADPRTLLRAYRLRGELLYYRGEYADALSHHESALRIARQLHDDREIALETVRKANVLGMLPGGTAEALASYRLASETLIRLGDFGEAAYAQLFLGVVESQHGHRELGLLELQKALTLAEEGHDPRRTGWARFNLADLEREGGNLEVAHRHNQKALRILTAVDDRFGLLQVQIIEGKIRLASGEGARAELALLEAYRLVRELQTPADEIEVLLRLVDVALARGDAPMARSRLEEAERIGLTRRPDLAGEWAEVRKRIEGGANATAHRL